MDFTFALVSGVFPLLSLAAVFLRVTELGVSLDQATQNFVIGACLIFSLPALLVWLPYSYFTIDNRKPGQLSFGILMAIAIVGVSMFLFIDNTDFDSLDLQVLAEINPESAEVNNL